MSASAMGSLVAEYFRHLAARGTDLLDALPIAREIRPIAATFATLVPALTASRGAELARLGAIARPPPSRPAAGPVGMNSVGILADRLTILICKQWFLRHRQQREAAAAAMAPQLADVAQALGQARPGDPGLLEKVGWAARDQPATGFVTAWFDLFCANLLMWETQELLYTRSMEAVPDSELRDYIRFFSAANLQRNRSIAEAETLYWSGG